MLRREFAVAALLGLILTACSSTPARDSTGPSDNRDRLGPSDIAGYISGLESDARIEELNPAGVLAKLALEPNSVVADIGCGPGVFTLRFARAMPRGLVYAVDVEPKQLDAVRAHLLAGGFENVVPVLASYSTPHLPAASCDLLFIADTYHHIDDRVAYMRRLQRVLRRGGRLALLEYKPGLLPIGPPPEHKLDEGVMGRELTEAGWTRVAHFDSHKYHTFEIWTPPAR